MTHDMAKQFWKVYIGMAGKDGAHVNMSNPVDDFKASAHAGDRKSTRLNSSHM